MCAPRIEGGVEGLYAGRNAQERHACPYKAVTEATEQPALVVALEREVDEPAGDAGLLLPGHAADPGNAATSATAIRVSLPPPSDLAPLGAGGTGSTGPITRLPRPSRDCRAVSNVRVSPLAAPALPLPLRHNVRRLPSR